MLLQAEVAVDDITSVGGRQLAEYGTSNGQWYCMYICYGILKRNTVSYDWGKQLAYEQ